MNRPIIFRPAARQDFLDACAWYDEQIAGLGARFERAVERTLEQIAAVPAVYGVVHRDVRRALVRPFPYGVFYRIRPDAIHVLAIMHGRRDPSLWESRTRIDD